MKAGGDMQQYEPRQGVPMTQKTEFMVVYDEENIYFGIIAYDTEPQKIVASVMERDEIPYYDDSLFLAIDTMNDNRNGYVLWTNPNGDGVSTAFCRTKTVKNGLRAAATGLLSPNCFQQRKEHYHEKTNRIICNGRCGGRCSGC